MRASSQVGFHGATDLASVIALANELAQVADESHVTMRTAAYILAISRVATATMIRGIYP